MITLKINLYRINIASLVICVKLGKYVIIVYIVFVQIFKFLKPVFIYLIIFDIYIKK